MAIVIVAAVGVLLFAMIWMTCNLLWVRKEHIQNDDRVARATFLQMLEAAESELLVKDDGDRSSELYFDEETATSVDARLEAEPKLVIRVLFNHRHQANCLVRLQQTDKYKDRSRLDVRIVAHPERRPVMEVHCKIADGGKYGCLSAHELYAHQKGARERELERFSAPNSWLGRQIIFRAPIQHFNDQFEQAEP